MTKKKKPLTTPEIQEIRNNSEMRQCICDMMIDLREERIDRHVAQEMNNAAGKIINSARLDLEYLRLIKGKGGLSPDQAINFLMPTTAKRLE